MPVEAQVLDCNLFVKKRTVRRHTEEGKQFVHYLLLISRWNLRQVPVLTSDLSVEYKGVIQRTDRPTEERTRDVVLLLHHRRGAARFTGNVRTPRRVDSLTEPPPPSSCLMVRGCQPHSPLVPSAHLDMGRKLFSSMKRRKIP